MERNRRRSTTRARRAIGHRTGRTVWHGTRCSRSRGILLGRLHDLIVEKVQGCAENHPFDTVLVSLSQGLPHSLFLGCFACDTNSSSTTVWTWWVLLYLSEFNALGGYIMTSISKVEHAPESSIRIGFGDLKEGEIGGVWGW